MLRVDLDERTEHTGESWYLWLVLYRSKVLPEPFSVCVRASLACVTAQNVLNDVLRYLVSSRNSNLKEVIIKNSVSFYDEEAIIQAI